MRKIYIMILLILVTGLVSCTSGGSGTLMGRVVDGFGNPLGGDAVMVTLSNNPAVHRPDQYGNFIVHAPEGDYTMKISFANPAAGFNYYLEQPVVVAKGTRNLGTFTLLNVQNMEAWAEYRDSEYIAAIDLFSEQADRARSAQLVWLPYMRYTEGEPGQNTLLTQGVLSAENGLGWCYSRGLHNHTEGKIHFEASLSGGYNNYDAYVGLAGIALGEGDGTTALELLEKVIDEPGLYDSTQIHDNIKEVDLMAAKALAQFLLGQDGYSRQTADAIRTQVEENGNAGSRDLLNALDQF